MDVQHLSLGRKYLVGDVRDSGDDIHVEFPEKTLLDDLQVQQPEESAAETEPQGKRRLRLIDERCIVELEFLERRPELFELVGLDRIHSGEHHRFHLLESGDGLVARPGRIGDGVTDLDLHSLLNA